MTHDNTLISELELLIASMQAQKEKLTAARIAAESAEYNAIQAAKAEKLNQYYAQMEADKAVLQAAKAAIYKVLHDNADVLVYNNMQSMVISISNTGAVSVSYDQNCVSLKVTEGNIKPLVGFNCRRKD